MFNPDIETSSGFIQKEQSINSEKSTSTGMHLKKTYSALFENRIDIFDKACSSLKKLEDGETKVFATKIIAALSRILYKINEVTVIDNFLKKLHLTKLDDGSVLIEWNFDNNRIGFSIEPDIEKTSYYIVKHDIQTGEYSSESRYIKEAEIDSIASYILQYVLRNT